MTALPPEIGPEDEIEVEWNRDDDGTMVLIAMEDVSILVSVDNEAGAQKLPWLIAALPRALDAAWDAINQQEDA